MAFLPRELGEAGALRVSDNTSDVRARKRDTAHKVREWIRETYGCTDPSFSIEARLLRQINQQRFDAAFGRNSRPARVS